TQRVEQYPCAGPPAPAMTRSVARKQSRPGPQYASALQALPRRAAALLASPPASPELPASARAPLPLPASVAAAPPVPPSAFPPVPVWTEVAPPEPPSPGFCPEEPPPQPNSHPVKEQMTTAPVRRRARLWPPRRPWRSSRTPGINGVAGVCIGFSRPFGWRSPERALSGRRYSIPSGALLPLAEHDCSRAPDNAAPTRASPRSFCADAEQVHLANRESGGWCGC